MKKFIQDVLSVGISKIIIIIFGLGTSIVIARYLGPRQNGIIAALLVYPSLFMSFGSLGIRQSTAYFLGKNVFSESKIKTAITQLWFFTTVISLLSCFLLMYYFSEVGKDINLTLIALAPIPFTLFNTYNSGIFLGKNQIGKFNKINWIPIALTFLFSILLIVFFDFQLRGYLIALLAGPAFIFFFFLFSNKFFHAFSLNFDWYILSKMLRLGIIYALALLVINLNYRIDIILLEQLSSNYETGIYSRGVSVTEYLWQIPMLLSTIVFSRSAVSKNNKNFSIKVLQLLRVSFLIILFACIIILILSKPIILLMYGSEFEGSANVLRILIPGVLLMTIFKVMNMDLSGKGKPWVSMKAMLPALLINVILNFLFIPKWGGDGAALASSLSYSIAAILFLYFYSTETNISIKNMIAFKRNDFVPLIQLLKR